MFDRISAHGPLRVRHTLGVVVALTLAGCGAATTPTRLESPSASPNTTPAAATSAPSPSPSPSPTTPVAGLDGLPPEGSWQVALTAEELVDAGWPADVTPPGTYTWTFADDRATIELLADEGDDVQCEADMVALAGNFELAYEDGACGGEVDVIAWELADDGLHMSLISTNAPLDQQKAYLETKPWQRIELEPVPSPS